MFESLEQRRLHAAMGLDPTYGVAGVVSLRIKNDYVGGGSEIRAAAFSAAGDAYVIVDHHLPGSAQTPNDTNNGIDELYHFTADGVFDSTFGGNGHLVVSRAYDGAYHPTIAVGGDGQLFVADVGKVGFYDATGHLQSEASKRFAGMQTGIQFFDPESTVFDSAGRLVVSGFVQGRRTTAFGVARYLSSGQLDSRFGRLGFSVLETDLGVNHSRVVISRTGRVVVLSAAASYPDPEPDGGLTFPSYGTTYADVLSPRGVPLANDAFDDGENDTGGLIFDDVVDARALADDGVALASDTRLAVVTGKMQFFSRPLPYPLPDPLRLTGSGVAVGLPGIDPADVYAPRLGHGSADPANPILATYTSDYDVLGDGRLIDATTVAGDGFSTLVLRRFDGTGLATPAAAGTAAIQSATRTLDIRGTSGDDAIAVRYRGKQVSVSINGHTQTFAVRDFDNIRIDGGDGNDTIAAKIGLLNRGVLIAGGAGDDVISTDAFRATVDGGDGIDMAANTRGSQLNLLSIER